MDVLNSIWHLLTTENEMLTKIVPIPCTFLEAWIGFLLFTSILKISYTKKQELIYIIFLFLSSLLTIFVIPTPYNILINYLIMFIAIKVIFKINIIKTFLSILIPIVIFALLGNLILNPLLKFFNISSEQLNLIPIYKIIYLALLYSITYIIILFLNRKKLNLNILNDLNSHSKHLVLTNLLLGIITIIIQLIITFYYINTYSLAFTLLNFISLFAYFFISFYSLTKAMELQITTRELENAENYNNTLSYLYDNVKAFKHDFNNIIFIIGGYISNNDMEGLKKYYIDLEKDCERVNNIEILNPQIINNPGIYNLLVAKYNKAELANIKISMEFFFDLEKLNMPIYEFARILGIFLDNAIEAASVCNDKQITLMFRDSPNQKTQIVKIGNTYTNKNVDISQIFEKGITEKNNHTGMGLWEVKQIIKRNNNVNLITTKDEEYFIQQLEIYY